MAVLGLLGLVPLVALTFPNLSTATAAGPPVARDDVARTDNGESVSVFVVGNDFDPDGDSFIVVSASSPANGSVVVFSNSVEYTPNAGFVGVDTITYTIQDSTGATAVADIRIWVDSGATGDQTPVANIDYLYVYQEASVAVTTSELLSNDSDPQGQTLTVVSVSEPGTEGTLTGDLSNGFTYTPSSDPSVIDTDHTLNYLVTDTDGHVAQSNVSIRILAAGDPNRAPVARDDVARTDNGAPVNVFLVGNDFDPDGDSFLVVKATTPAHGAISVFSN
ncbi:MAG TPA: Ig-like domain-containing protein, partial [Ilumatobacteraceae bacterium]|nr:Ig-like domain-containing protein [Ilumatobacteraceae bacterium]